MAKKITVNLEIVTPETADYFSATVACPADHSEAAENANAALAYVADKGRRALGFLTETQLQQQREQLESLADSLGGMSEDEPVPAEAPAAELELTHDEFQQAMENVAHNLAVSGVEGSMRYPVHAALDMVRGEFLRLLAEAEGGPVPDEGPELDDVLTHEAQSELRLSAAAVRRTLRRAANTYDSGTFPLYGVVDDVRIRLQEQFDFEHGLDKTFETMGQDTADEAMPEVKE